MNKLKHYISVLGMMTMISIVIISCGLVDYDFDEIEENGYAMHLNRDTVYIMEGDTFSLSPIYTPVLSDANVFWKTTSTILSIKDNNIIATQTGETYVKAYSSYHSLIDSCYVCVMPRWTTPQYDFPDETIVYATVDIGGKPFDASRMRIAAYIDGECRGEGTMKDYFGRSIVQFRVCGNQDDYGKTIRIRLYILDELYCEYLQETVTFNGETFNIHLTSV